MKYEFQILVLFVLIGLLRPRLNARGWVAVALLVFAYIMYNWKFA